MTVSFLREWWGSRNFGAPLFAPPPAQKGQEPAAGPDADLHQQADSKPASGRDFCPQQGCELGSSSASRPWERRVESWRDGSLMSITVEEHAGQRLWVEGTTHVPLPPSLLFELITHPANEQIFRHLERCEDRVVVHDSRGDPALVQGGGDSAQGGVRVVESEHVASWRFLMLSGTLRMRLRVEQRPGEGRVDFELLPSPSPPRLQPMRYFSGSWQVQALPEGSRWEEGGQGVHAALTLRQEMQPAVYLPPPLSGLFRSIACRQLRGIFEDIHAEAKRIRKGQPTLWDADSPFFQNGRAPLTRSFLRNPGSD